MREFVRLRIDPVPDPAPETTVTEVPEHLLKKAAEARARLTGEGGDAAADDAPAASAASTAPVPAAAAAVPAEPEPEPEPIPDNEMVAAAKARKTIPVWVMPVLLFLPIWAIYYVGYLEDPPVEGGLAVEGAEVYSTAGCAGCHGGGGGGGTGRQLSDGEVLRTFPVGITDAGYDGLAGHITWVVQGTAGTASNGDGGLYGDADRAGGQRSAGSFGSMGGNDSSIEEIAAVVFHERVQFGGDLIDADHTVEELELLEEFIHVAEEQGITSLADLSYEDVHELLNEARGKLGGEAA